MEGRIEVVTASGFFYNKTKGILEHKHPIFQIFYVLSGVGMFQYEGKDVSIFQDEFLFVAPNKMHGLTPPPIKTAMLDMKFNILDLQFERELLKLPFRCSNNPPEIIKLFEMIGTEAKEKKGYFNRVISLLLETIILIRLREQYRDQYNTTENYDRILSIYNRLDVNYEELSDCVKRAIAEIEGSIVHPVKRVSLDYLANIIGCSKSYLGRTFSREMGCTIKQFITMLRMDKAKEMLICSNLSIKEIAAMLDYSRDSYFCSKFLEMFGESPTTYRHRKHDEPPEYLNYSFHDEFSDPKSD